MHPIALVIGLLTGAAIAVKTDEILTQESPKKRVANIVPTDDNLTVPEPELVPNEQTHGPDDLGDNSGGDNPAIVEADD